MEFVANNIEEVKDAITKTVDAYSPDIFHADGRITFSNNIFVISVYYTGDAHLWARDGAESLWDMSLKKVSGAEIVDKFCSVIENYIAGYVPCSDCGKLLSKEDIAGYYYAGTYCKDCWERYWKQTAASDNHD